MTQSLPVCFHFLFRVAQYISRSHVYIEDLFLYWQPYFFESLFPFSLGSFKAISHFRTTNYTVQHTFTSLGLTVYNRTVYIVPRALFRLNYSGFLLGFLCQSHFSFNRFWNLTWESLLNPFTTLLTWKTSVKPNAKLKKLNMCNIRQKMWVLEMFHPSFKSINSVLKLQ